MLRTVGNGLGYATPGQIPGTTTNDNAAAGMIGEYVSNTIASGSAVPLTTNQPANVATISLTAGDWDVAFDAWFTGNAATTVTRAQSGPSVTSNTLPTTLDALTEVAYNAVTIFNNATTISQGGTAARFSLANTTTIFAVSQATFGVNSMSAYGILRARRVR